MQLKRAFLFLGISVCALLLIAMAARTATAYPLPVLSTWESAQRYRSTSQDVPLPLAPDAVGCFCPAVPCSRGSLAGCTAQCYAPKTALCRCEATCDLYAKPVGINLCCCE
jgi:hypothetical protein